MPHPGGRKVTITATPDQVVYSEQPRNCSASSSSRQHQAPEPQLQPRHPSRKDSESKFRESFKVPARYKVAQLLGAGAYGRVAQAYDHDRKKSVAIKQARHLFRALSDAKRLLREAAILGALDHPNICRLYDIVAPADVGAFNEIYMVLELSDSDLQKLCRAAVHLEPIHVTSLLYNLLVGLNYLHSAGIWHRDLKPANCLVNEDCSVKICDFGLARAVGGELSLSGWGDEHSDRKQAHARNLTGHVVTRWYRAPELILLQENYTEAIDLWSVGCIYGELLETLPGVKFDARSPLFPGHSCYPLSPNAEHKTDARFYTRGTRDQLSMICALIGTPSAEDVEQLEGQDAQDYMRCFPRRDGSGVSAKFGHLDRTGSDLLEKMLVFNPSKRIKVADALNHALFSKVRARSRETTAGSLVSLAFERDQNLLLDERNLRIHFLREVRKYHPEVPQLP